MAWTKTAYNYVVEKYFEVATKKTTYGRGVANIWREGIPNGGNSYSKATSYRAYLFREFYFSREFCSFLVPFADNFDTERQQ